MQCRGVDAVYVSGRGSQEPYKDSLNPEKFAGVLPVLYDDHQGNVIYRVPRRWPAGSRVDGYEPSGLPSPFIGER